MDTCPRVNFTAQRSLHDDGSVEFNNREVEKYIQHNYPDWLTAFHMVPQVFTFSGEQTDQVHRKGDDAEGRVYRLLHELGNDLGDPMFVIHSFSFNEQVCRGSDIWRVYGETDFVIVSKKYGVIFMEVKAVSSYGILRKRFKKAQDQINKARQALAEYLKGKVPSDASTALFRNPAFVAMPNCGRPQDSMARGGTGTSGVSGRCGFGKTCTEVYCAVAVFFNRKCARFIGLRSATTRTLGKLVDDTTRDVLQMFNSQQLALLNNVGLPRHQLITGPAGSGKTSILLHKVQALNTDISKTGKQEKILVLCYNKPLRTRLTKELERCRWVTVHTLDSILYELSPVGSKDVSEMCDEEKSALVDRVLHDRPRIHHKCSFDHIFVDEGQDFIGDWRALLKEIQAKSLCKRKFHWIFLDNNQHVYKTAAGFSEEELANAIQLNKVYRMTGSVFDQFKKYFSGPGEETEYSIGHDIMGLCIEWDKMDQTHGTALQTACDHIYRHVHRLLGNNVCGKDICVLLWTFKDVPDVVEHLQARGIQCQNAEDSIMHPVNSAIIVDSLSRFKGLETKVLILYDLPCLTDGEDGERAREHLYTALSRCFCLLIIIAPARVVQSLQSGRCQSPINQSYAGING
ncbi:Hypp5922 [Branchiostoma lanceolatum]|uniref:Hypp5922 protein n=1 Tax=Branchiostoma lanceolatum TaxID=7740 RepID=A0A8J9YS31_BRALA|nr:Hypp5922 [Branchiostoma lanceolatum]